MTRKVILTCAVVGENQYNKAHPNFPITPQQIADAALEAEQAGASAVHLHARDPENGTGRAKLHVLLRTILAFPPSELRMQKSCL